METNTTFSAYETTMTNKAGKTYGVRVINRRENCTRKDGSVGALLKIQEIYYRQNPSPYAEKNIKSYMSPIWVKSEAVN